MKQSLLTAVAFALIGGTVACAQDPAPRQREGRPVRGKAVEAQPARVQAQPVPLQPGGAAGRVLPVTAARLATLEEELETLEVQRDIRRGHLTAAEVGVKMADVSAKRVKILYDKGAATREDAEKAHLEVEAAKAQLDIRAAEIKEVEVKIKYAKKRLDEAKAAPVRPVPGVRPVDPKPVDPPPAVDNRADPTTPAQVDPKAVAELKRLIDDLTVAVAAKKEAAKKAADEASGAAAEHAKILDLATKGIVAPDAIQKAEAKAKAAKAAAEIAAAVVTKTEAELKAAKLKLELFGK